MDWLPVLTILLTLLNLVQRFLQIAETVLRFWRRFKAWLQFRRR